MSLSVALGIVDGLLVGGAVDRENGSICLDLCFSVHDGCCSRENE